MLSLILYQTRVAEDRSKPDFPKAKCFRRDSSSLLLISHWACFYTVCISFIVLFTFRLCLFLNGDFNEMSIAYFEFIFIYTVYVHALFYKTFSSICYSLSNLCFMQRLEGGYPSC